MRSSRRTAALLALAALACRGQDRTADGSGSAGSPGGTLVISIPTDPGTLLPPFAVGGVTKAAADQVFDHLADIGPDLNTVGDRGYTPRLADRWSWAPDSLSIAFHIDPRARWHDGQPVRAQDVRFTWQVYHDAATGSPFAELIADIDSVQVRDAATAAVWFHRRAAAEFFEATQQMEILPEHLLGSLPHATLRSSDFGRHPVGTGRFRFVRQVPGQVVELVSDTANYHGRARLDRILWSVAPDPTAALTRLTRGEADFLEMIPPPSLPEVQHQAALKTLPYQTLAYSYLGFNLHDRATAAPHPVLGDVHVRRALSMGIDRAGIVHNVYDTLAVVAHGPTVRALGPLAASLRPIPYDTAGAARLLDSLGWRRGADGIRARNGRPLMLGILTPSSSAVRVRLAVLLQEQLRRLGVKADVDQVDFQTFMGRLTKRDYDAVVGLWSVDPDPASSLQQNWSAAAAAPGGSNFSGYVAPAVDATVDSAVHATEPTRREALFRRAYQQVVDDAPAVWLYEPLWVAGMSRRVQPTSLRADAWWAGLADWSIPPAQRIARDRVGLSPRG